jgi:putative FmdB family regulatory protein
MPLYEYACPDCRRDCELLIRGQEQPICPSCGGRQLNKLLSVPAPHTAGSSSKALPSCGPNPSGDCGLPQCSSGRCLME